MANSVVVSKSRYFWDLAVDPLYDNKIARIDWRVFLPASGGSRHQREYLLRSVRGLMQAMLEKPRQVKGEHLSHATVKNWTFEIRRLIRWMTERDIWRFSSLNGQDVAEYIQRCAVLENGAGKVREFTLGLRLSIVQEMWELRGLYAGALRVNPATLDIDALRECAPQRSSWRALDEDDAKSLLGDAIRWLRKHGEYMVSVTQRRWKLERKFVGRSFGFRKTAIQKFYEAIGQEHGMAALREDLLIESVTPAWRVLRCAYQVTDGACFTILLFIVGMRVSELVRLDAGCVRFDTTSDGTNVARIQGIAAKKGGKSRTWIVTPEVIEVIQYFEALLVDARKISGAKPLILGHEDRIASLSPFRGRRISRGVIAVSMRAFANGKHRRNRKLKQRLHPHVARKTFARFVVTRDKSALESLSYHFGHVYTSITDGSYGGVDIELRALLTEESRKDLERALTDLISSDHIAGKAGAAMQEFRAKARFRGKRGLKSLVQRLISEGVQLAPCYWGYCVYCQSTSACHGDVRGPNEVLRSPDVCSGCPNFAATERHRPWWEVRFSRDECFLKTTGLVAQTIKLVEKRMSNTIRILQDLNAKEGASHVETEESSAEGKDTET
jgi:site-specific recombinase XerC